MRRSPFAADNGESASKPRSIRERARARAVEQSNWRPGTFPGPIGAVTATDAPISVLPYERTLVK
jgi:hypothetical protein